MLSGTILVAGRASGPVVFSDTPLSFMMGVDATTGIVVDSHHPLRGVSLVDTVLAIPFGRGSCSGSGAILELLVSDLAPAALIFNEMEDILTLGVIIGQRMFSKPIPVILIEDKEAFSSLADVDYAQITTETLQLKCAAAHSDIPLMHMNQNGISLTPADQAMLDGTNGPAAQIAMEIIVSYAALQGAETLLTISQVHIDACFYIGKCSLLVPERLNALKAKFVVPATCNALSVDRLRWQELGVESQLSRDSIKIGDLYVAMGSKPTFTCAPYLLESKPETGDQIAWAESNAVAFANSVLGARTQKYPDYLEVFIAITGRAPNSGCHLPRGRVPKVLVEVCNVDVFDSSLFPLLGYHVGSVVRSGVPLISGLEKTCPTQSDLKAFSAGFATSSACPMFHISGITPEASAFKNIEDTLAKIQIDTSDLRTSWRVLNTAKDNSVDLVSLGNPHFGIEEFGKLAELCRGKQRSQGVEMKITTGRDTYQKALSLGYLDDLDLFGAQVITDTCWCMIQEPIVPPHTRNIMTNSSKYAHYGPGVLNKGFHFGSLEACVDTACKGERAQEDMQPSWLFQKKQR